jgi:hypothetical protein
MSWILKTLSKASVRRIALALCLSFLAHILAFSTMGLSSFQGGDSVSGSLQIKLVGPGASASKLVEEQAASERAEEQFTLPPLTADSTKSAMASNKSAVKKKAADLVTQPSAVLTPVIASAAPGSKEAGRTDTLRAIPLPGLSGVVHRVEIDFEIFVGANRQSSGFGRHIYVSPDGENYGLSVEQLPGKDAATNNGAGWGVKVSGRISRQGLSPILYDVQGVVAERLIALNAVPGLSDDVPNISRKGRMADGLVDRQSLIYQFMIRPPEMGGGKIWLSDGVRQSLFLYGNASFDFLPTTFLGGVRAIKLVLASSENTETIELWVVPDMHFLPVKVRHTDQKGVVTEQVAVSLDFNE